MTKEMTSVSLLSISRGWMVMYLEHLVMGFIFPNWYVLPEHAQMWMISTLATSNSLQNFSLKDTVFKNLEKPLESFTKITKSFC